MENAFIPTIKAYYFKHREMNLAPVYAATENEARVNLMIVHQWCNAPYNSELIRTELGTEYDRICDHKTA